MCVGNAGAVFYAVSQGRGLLLEVILFTNVLTAGPALVQWDQMRYAGVGSRIVGNT
jgi:hypothetical protein